MYLLKQNEMIKVAVGTAIIDLDVGVKVEATIIPAARGERRNSKFAVRLSRSVSLSVS